MRPIQLYVEAQSCENNETLEEKTSRKKNRIWESFPIKLRRNVIYETHNSLKNPMMLSIKIDVKSCTYNVFCILKILPFFKGVRKLAEY